VTGPAPEPGRRPRLEVVVGPVATTHIADAHQSAWVADFHGRLLRSRRVLERDPRPAAWTATAGTADDAAALAELRGWLEVQLEGRDAVVVADPAAGWFVPLWSRVTRDLAVDLSYLVVLHHTGADDAAAAAGWVNLMLGTEHATRGFARSFVTAGGPADEPVGTGLAEPLERVAGSASQRLVALAQPGADEAGAAAALDECRAAYRACYAGIEALVAPSLPGPLVEEIPDAPTPAAASPGAGPRTGGDAVIRVAERLVPRELLRKVPPLWRARLLRAVTKVGRTVRR
jgi:hypothetical protein